MLNIACLLDASDDPDKMEHLISLDGAKERLHLFAADLVKDGSFDEMVDGCEGVFHTASPVKTVVSDPQVKMKILYCRRNLAVPYIQLLTCKLNYFNYDPCCYFL